MDSFRLERNHYLNCSKTKHIYLTFRILHFNNATHFHCLNINMMRLIIENEVKNIESYYIV